MDEEVPVADFQIMGELIHGGDIILQGKYGYIPDSYIRKHQDHVAIAKLKTYLSGWG